VEHWEISNCRPLTFKPKIVAPQGEKISGNGNWKNLETFLKSKILRHKKFKDKALSGMKRRFPK